MSLSLNWITYSFQFTTLNPRITYHHTYPRLIKSPMYYPGFLHQIVQEEVDDRMLLWTECFQVDNETFIISIIQKPIISTPPNSPVSIHPNTKTISCSSVTCRRGNAKSSPRSRGRSANGRKAQDEEIRRGREGGGGNKEKSTRALSARAQPNRALLELRGPAWAGARGISTWWLLYVRIASCGERGSGEEPIAKCK